MFFTTNKYVEFVDFDNHNNPTKYQDHQPKVMVKLMMTKSKQTSMCIAMVNTTPLGSNKKYVHHDGRGNTFRNKQTSLCIVMERQHL
jgi:hypothetical protein